MQKQKNKRTGSIIITSLLVTAMLAGVSLLLYPTFANWWNQRTQTTVINEYEQIISKLSNEEHKKVLLEAEEYNREWSKKQSYNAVLTDDELAAYKKVFSFTDNDTMGYIEIPAINVRLAVYQGTDESVLRVGIGHLDWTALPVGGASTHCVLSGHRGLPSARLFTDLPKLVVGDTFTLTVLGELFTYEVDRIETVLPEDIEGLMPVDGRDYCTLMTCTPYGVNSHRILVRGHRIENISSANGRVQANAARVSQMLVALFIGVPVIVVLFFGALITSGVSTRKKRSNKNVKSIPNRDESPPEPQAPAEEPKPDGSDGAE